MAEDESGSRIKLIEALLQEPEDRRSTGSEEDKKFFAQTGGKIILTSPMFGYIKTHFDVLTVISEKNGRAYSSIGRATGS